MKGTFMSSPVTIITGASSGIGAAAARRLAQEGMCLTLAARREGRLRNLAEEVEKLGGQALVVPTDVTQLADLHRMVQGTLDRWGRIDVLLNNAGVSYDGAFMDFESDRMRTGASILLGHRVHSFRPAVMPEGGHIINVASIEALIATPGSSVYCATKFGVFGFSDALRRELRGTGIHVSAFCPGYTPSELTPRLRAHVEGRPDAPHHPGMMPVGYVADEIARLIRHPQRLVVIPRGRNILVVAAFLFPWLADILVARFKARRTAST
jgi:short-subunit dehydrogenase